MPRRYDTTRRRKATEQTRRDIVRAALKLHWDGITGYEAMGAEAGCSAATVRLHYPTKEHLFSDCTQAFGETLVLPDPESIARIEDAADRTEQAIRELFRVHEAMLGYAWHSARWRSDSPTLDSVMASYEELADAIAAIVTPGDGSLAGLIRGLLDFLTYRALRLSGGLDPPQAVAQITHTVLHLNTNEGRRKP